MSTFIVLLAAKAFFLVHGIRKESSEDIRYSFMIISSVLAAYMIFRDVTYFNWKGYYF